MSAVAPDNAAQRVDEEELARAILEITRALAAELHPQVAGIGTLGVDASIERDFGLDSLARVELAQRIERATGKRVPDSAFAESETVCDLARALLFVGGIVPPAVGLTPQVVGESVAPPEFPKTLLDALEWHAARQPARAHVVLIERETGPEEISYGKLRSSALAVAAGLALRGIRPGETVAIMLPTGREFFAAFYGALYAQAIPVPLYPPARASQIEAHLRRVAAILANCEARVLVTVDRARRLGSLLRSLGTRLESIVTVEEIAAPQASLPLPSSNPGDIALLQYTSGSTGQPKGVVLTHANLLSNLHAMQRVTGVSSADTFVSWLPLYHDMGLIGACIGALVVGFRLVLMSPLAFLTHPACWLRAVSQHRGTITAAPNFAFELCVNKIDDAELAALDLKSLRLVFNGAEAVSAQTMQRFVERFAPRGLRPEALMPVYGLAECALGLTFPPAGRGLLIDRIARDSLLRSGLARLATEADPAPLSVVSCGAPLPGYAIRIVDARSNALPERTQGRVQFQGPSATSGYFRNPQETARLFDGEWLDTGDLGYLGQGELFVTGRAKDIIIRGGHNIHPQELEQAVARLAGVRKGGVVVFPASDTRSGTEKIVVLAETREERPTFRAAIIADINRLAVDLIGLPVDEVVLARAGTVLKTSSGKVRRAACRSAYERGELGAAVPAPWLQLARLTCEALSLRLRRAARRSLNIGWGLRVLIVGACLAAPLWFTVVLTPGLARRRRAAAAYARLALRLAGVSLEVTGRERIAPGPRIFVANHASYLDALVLMAALPSDVAFIAKREFRTSIALGLLFERLGCVFVERFDVQEAAGAVAELDARLRAGESLVAFAEGTFRRDAGLLPFHMGAFSAAAATGALIIPVAIRGTRSMLPDGSRLPNRCPIDVICGASIAPADAGWRSAVDLRRRAREHILHELHEPDLEQRLPGASR